MTGDILMQAALNGDWRCIARAISALENGGVDALEVRKAIAGLQGRSHVIGVTGPPGGGKSTLVSVIIKGRVAWNQ